MPLEFHGLAVFEPDTGSVRFTGYRPKSSEPVLCHLTRDAIVLLVKNFDQSPALILRFFDQHADEIREIASAKYDKGFPQPVVTAKDLIDRRTRFRTQ